MPQFTDREYEVSVHLALPWDQPQTILGWSHRQLEAGRDEGMHEHRAGELSGCAAVSGSEMSLNGHCSSYGILSGCFISLQKTCYSIVS